MGFNASNERFIFKKKRDKNWMRFNASDRNLRMDIYHRVFFLSKTYKTNSPSYEDCCHLFYLFIYLIPLLVPPPPYPKMSKLIY